MTTKEFLLKWVDKESDMYFGGAKPIYAISLFEYPDREYTWNDGTKSGLPDFGCDMEVGYFYSLEEAIEAMNTNSMDMRECVYNAGFILCRFPGLYNNVAGREARMYFVWNDDEGGFFQAEEPEIFEHMAY